MLADHREQFVTLPNDMTLCFAQHGNPDHPSIVLIAGLGLQMVYWPEDLISQLVGQGFQVICFDNRDAGRSSRSQTPHPGRFQQLTGKAPEDGYGLEHMAEDTTLLLEHLGVQCAHIVGMSMGGMIAQTLAIRYPHKVATMVSIFSTTGNRRVGQPAVSTLWRMMRAKAPQNEQEAVENYARMMGHIGDPNRPNAPELWRRYAALAWRRNGERADPKAMFRQIGAIFKSGDRTPDLKQVNRASLIIHGDKDPMVHPSGGRATAKAIPQADYQVVTGMRHQIDDHQSAKLAHMIVQHIRKNEGAMPCN